MAQMLYIRYCGPSCPFRFSDEGGGDGVWHVFDDGWRECGKDLSRIRSIVQFHMPTSLAWIRAAAVAEGKFPERETPKGMEPHPKMEFLDKFAACLEKAVSVRPIIEEANMFFHCDIERDSKPDVFQCADCVLDLCLNIFRRVLPSDYCLRRSKVVVPERWLTDPALMEREAAPLLEKVAGA